MNGLVRRTAWALAFAVLAVFFQSFLRQPLALWLTAALAAFTILAAVRPYAGLIVFAALGPLATIIFGMGRGAAGNVVLAEAIALAFASGWTARQAVLAEPLRVPTWIRFPALLLALLAAASGVVQWFGIRAEAPLDPWRPLLDWYVLRDYPLRPPGIEPISSAVVLFSGMILVLGPAHICAADPTRRATAAGSMVFGAAAAAVFSVRRIVEVATGSATPLPAFIDHLQHTRISVHYGDKNAAGSYFAMTLITALGFVTIRPALTVLAMLFIGAALWLTGSRVAFASVFIALVTLAATTLHGAASRRARRTAVVALIVVLIGGAGLYRWYPAGRNIAAWKAFEIRAELMQAGLQMASENPVFGVGLGRFYRLSSNYAGETLAKFGFARENAHNNFVQVLAELGIPGLAVFLLLLGAALSHAMRHEGRPPLHVMALAAGILAYLLSALAGHPLVVPDATYPFWLAVGLASAPMNPLGGTGMRTKAVVAVLAAAIVVTVPWRAKAAIAAADLEHVSYGFSMWQGEADSWRYRFIGGHATFYVPAAARAVQVPMRTGTIVRRTIEVTVLADGREVNRVLLPADDLWRTVRFLVRPSASGARFVRVDLVAAEPGQPPFEEPATAGSGVVLVRRPLIER